MRHSKVSLDYLRSQLSQCLITLTDEEFGMLTFKELQTAVRKAKKAYKLYEAVDKIISKN